MAKRTEIWFIAVALSICLVPSTGRAALAAGRKGHSQRNRTFLVIPGRPRLREETYKGCGPWGNGGDSDSNYLRNRIDLPSGARTLSFKQFLGLDVPRGVAMTPMRHWSRQARNHVYRYEGMAVSLEGYIAKVSQGPKEQANCMGKAGYDWHIRIGTTPHAPNGHSIITEATPRVRAREGNFSMKTLDSLERRGGKVRITGWLFLDNDHPTDLDRQRATLWEIHPVTRIDAWQKGHWTKIAG